MRHKEEKNIVIDTSPWIALSICGKTALLKRLYKDIYMPEGVKEEILEGGKESIGVKELKKANWLKIERVADIEKVKLLYELGKGESEVIILAKEKRIKYVLIDEKIARLQAKVLGLEVIGTLGLLLKAKSLGVIPAIKPLIKKMKQKGIWIDEDIVKGILKEAKESYL